jgi:hypothetical protein
MCRWCVALYVGVLRFMTAECASDTSRLYRRLVCAENGGAGARQIKSLYQLADRWNGSINWPVGISAIHPKAMPVILGMPEKMDTWLAAPGCRLMACRTDNHPTTRQTGDNIQPLLFTAWQA